MPPRFAYWTILIDDKPTAFRAHEREELLPTFVQLKRTNPNIVMKWFTRGKLWDTPEQAQWAARHPIPREKRDAAWRPGGEHRDPRARFKKHRDERPRTESGSREKSGEREKRGPREKPGAPGQRPKTGFGSSRPRFGSKPAFGRHGRGGAQRRGKPPGRNRS